MSALFSTNFSAAVAIWAAAAINANMDHAKSLIVPLPNGLSGALVQLRTLSDELDRFLLHALLQPDLRRQSLLRRVVAHILRDLHAAEVRAAHRAKVRGLHRVLRQ